MNADVLEEGSDVFGSEHRMWDLLKLQFGELDLVSNLHVYGST